jgi:hypothetical protein
VTVIRSADDENLMRRSAERFGLIDATSNDGNGAAVRGGAGVGFCAASSSPNTRSPTTIKSPVGRDRRSPFIIGVRTAQIADIGVLYLPLNFPGERSELALPAILSAKLGAFPDEDYRYRLP